MRILTSGLALALLTGVGVTTLPDASWAARFFACRSGETFEENNNAARCVRPDEFRALQACPQVQTPLGPVGYGLVEDHNNTNRDKCVTQAGGGFVSNAIDPPCPNGFQVQVRNGRDRCRKPGTITAPTREVDR